MPARRRLLDLKPTTSDTADTVECRVYEAIRARGGAGWPDELALELEYSLLEVLDALERLRKKGRVEEAPELVMAQ